MGRTGTASGPAAVLLPVGFVRFAQLLRTIAALITAQKKMVVFITLVRFRESERYFRFLLSFLIRKSTQILSVARVFPQDAH